MNAIVGHYGTLLIPFFVFLFTRALKIHSRRVLFISLGITLMSLELGQGLLGPGTNEQALFLFDEGKFLNAFLITVFWALLCLGLGHEPDREDKSWLLLMTLTIAKAMIFSKNFESAYLFGQVSLLMFSGVIGMSSLRPANAEAGYKLFRWSTLLVALGAVGLALTFSDSSVRSVGLFLCALWFLFFMGAPPFHLAITDVIDGSGAAASAGITFATRFCGVVVFCRWIQETSLQATEFWTRLYPILSSVLIIGSAGAFLLCLLQNKLKRALGYFSAGHTGYALFLWILSHHRNAGDILNTVSTHLFVVHVLIVGILASARSMKKSGASEIQIQDFKSTQHMGWSDLALLWLCLGATIIVSPASLSWQAALSGATLLGSGDSYASTSLAIFCVLSMTALSRLIFFSLQAGPQGDRILGSIGWLKTALFAAAVFGVHTREIVLMILRRGIWILLLLSTATIAANQRAFIFGTKGDVLNANEGKKNIKTQIYSLVGPTARLDTPRTGALLLFIEDFGAVTIDAQSSVEIDLRFRCRINVIAGAIRIRAWKNTKTACILEAPNMPRQEVSGPSDVSVTYQPYDQRAFVDVYSGAFTPQIAVTEKGAPELVITPGRGIVFSSLLSKPQKSEKHQRGIASWAVLEASIAPITVPRPLFSDETEAFRQSVVTKQWEAILQRSGGAKAQGRTNDTASRALGSQVLESLY